MPVYLKVLGFVAVCAIYDCRFIVFNWWVSSASDFQCCYFFESSCLFYLSFNSDFYVSKIMHI